MITNRSFRATAVAVLLLLAGALASAQNQSVTASFKDTPMSEVLAKIEKQTGLSFMYESQINLTKPVTANFDHQPVSEVLKQLLGNGAEITFKGRIVVIKAPQQKAAPATTPTRKQVRGRVTDSAGEPLSGASVMVKGTRQGAIADLDGWFTLQDIDFPARMTVSYIGYADQDITVNGDEKDLNIVLDDSMNILEDVVVVGYGTQKRVNVTGSVSVIDGQTLNARPVTNAAIAVQGADPGLTVSMGNGSIEGTQVTLNIRGNVSINSGSPLVLVDGVDGSLSQVNPNDIESISILKDASACALYGARASAGVILITTKSGSEGVTRINYSGRAGISMNTTSTDFMTCGYDYVTLCNEFYTTEYGYGSWTYNEEQMQMLYERRNDVKEDPSRPWVVPDESGVYTWLYLGNFDWYGYLFKRVRPETEHNVSVTGGNDRVKYYASGRYLYREGVFNNGAADFYNGFSFRTKLDAKITKWLSYTANISYEKTKYDYGGFYEQDGADAVVLTNGNHSAFYNANQNISPTYVPFNPDGSINVQPGFMDAASQLGTGRVPTWMDGRNENRRTKKYLTLMNRFVFDICKGLKFTADYTYKDNGSLAAYRCHPIANAYDNINKRFYPEPGYTSGAIYDFYQETRLDYDAHIVNAFLNYDAKLGKHSLGFTAGMNFNDVHQTQVKMRQKGSISDDLAYIDLANGTIDILTENNTAYRTIGFFARLNYSYADRYLLELSGRYDGTSRFPVGDRWCFFPSVSAGWRMSEEPFWEPLKSVWNKAKLRLSYGALGNQQVSNYYYWDLITTSQLSYTFDGENKAPKATVSNPVSPNLTWETVVSYNLGLDLGFFRDRLNVSADAFIRDTKNMLTSSMTLPSTYGASAPKENAADLRTTGYEIAISWNETRKVLGEPLSYGATFTLGDYVSKITRFNNPNNSLSSNYVGKTLGEIWGFHINGLFKSDEEAEIYSANIDDRSYNKGVYSCIAPYNKLMAGDIIIHDSDGNGVISTGANTLDDPGDRKVIGNSLPRYQYAIKTNFSWYGVDLSLFIQGVGKRDWMPDNLCDYFWMLYHNQRPTFLIKDFEKMCWSPENPDAYFPRRRSHYAGTVNGPRSLSYANDYFLQNAAYIRLKNITVGYTLPLKTKAIQKCRFYFNGENLGYWSPMKKHCKTVDPEIATSASHGDNMYPFSMTLSLGVDITF